MTDQVHFEMNGDQNENVIDTSTVHSDGVTKTVTTTSITKKYETTTAEKSREKIIREPKKLENSHYQIKSEEFTKDADKNGNLLHKEQDLVTYSTPGLDYSKTKYQKAAEQEGSSVATHISSNSKWSRSSSNSGTSPPVNKVVINKVAPPEITKNVRSIFENGRFSDVHEIRKLDVANDPLADGGIYESEPIILDGVVRGTDIMNDVKFDAGYALNTRHQFETQKEFQITRDPIKIEAFNPVVIENEPTTLPDDVVRGSMINSEKPSLEGLNLKERMSQLNETKPLLKKEIKLVDDNSTSESNFENQPIIRTDVIRESDSTQNQIDIESGRIKGIQTVFIDGQDKTIERAPIIIDRSTSGITENEPTILEGVAREGDRLEENVLQSGGAKKMKEQWLNIDSEYHSKGRFQMDIDPQGAIILESTPEIRSDVVRCDDVMQDSMTTELGHSKNLADRFNHWGENKPRVERKISIDQSQGCILENEPEQRTDVVKSGGPTGWEIDFEAGHTKNLKEKWCSAAQEADTPKPKPLWQLELESAKECGIFENEPTHNDGVIRECDVVQSTDVPVQTKNLKNLWLNKESEIEAGLAARRSSQPQMVRFTPPREVTPPPYLKEYQEIVDGVDKTSLTKFSDDPLISVPQKQKKMRKPVSANQDVHIKTADDQYEEYYEEFHDVSNGDVPNGLPEYIMDAPRKSSVTTLTFK